MDPNVQVAMIGVFTTFITTMGIVGAAYITSLQNRAKSAEKVVEEVVDDELDEGDVMEKILGLIGENERKERYITELQRNVAHLTQDVRALRTENTLLRLGKYVAPPDEEPDL